MPDKTYAKVVLNGTTYVDLTSDTVDPSTLLAGYTAHDRSGALITGTFDSSIFVLKAGDTMTGPLILSGAPTENLHAATKKYVDDSVAKYLPLTGGVMGGVVDDPEDKNHGYIYTNTILPDYITLNKDEYYNHALVGNFYSSITPGNITLSKLYTNTSTYYVGTSILNDSELSFEIGPYGGSRTKYASYKSNGISYTTYNYVFPSKSGTFALTNDLLSYIPKTGGTITGGYLIIDDTHLTSGSSSAYLTLGNNVDSSSEGSSFGALHLYGTGVYKSSIRTTTLTDNRQLYLPDKDGTLAVTDDLYSQKINSTNIIDKTMFAMGSLTGSNGSDTYADTRLRSAFIPVNANTTYSISTGNSLLIYEIHEYMSSKAFVQYTSANATSKSFKTNATTSFIKILLRKTTNDTIGLSDIGNIQMNKGDSLETFKSYIPDINEINAYNVYAYNLSHRFIQDQSLPISANSNINSLPYLRPGQYVCNNYQTSLSITNIPKQDVFTMSVESPISDVYNDEVNTSYGRYRERTIKYTNGDTWVQTCSAQTSSSSWTYGDWKPVIIGYKAGNLQVNTSGASLDEAYCKQYGKTVNVRAWLTGLSTSTQTHTNVITVQLVDKPTTAVRFVFTCWLGNGIAAYAGYGVMDTSGRITLVKAVANSDKASFEFTYNV